MSIYNANRRLHPTKLVNDVRNGLALRSDLNQPAFDAGKFAIVPKVRCDLPSFAPSSATDFGQEDKLVAHFLEFTHELGVLYHNRELHPIPQVAREFLYARFAWSIFPLLASFLSGGPKYLRLFVRTPLGFSQKDELLNWRDVLKERETRTRKRPRGAGPDGSQKDEPMTVDSNTGFSGDIDVDQPGTTGSTSSEAAHPVINSLEALTSYFASSTENDNEDMIRDRRMQELAFPEMAEEKVHGAGPVWEDITWYPGSARTERLKQVLSRDRGWVQILAGRKRSLECDDDEGSERVNMQRRV